MISSRETLLAELADRDHLNELYDADLTPVECLQALVAHDDKYLPRLVPQMSVDQMNAILEAAGRFDPDADGEIAEFREVAGKILDDAESCTSERQIATLKRTLIEKYDAHRAVHNARLAPVAPVAPEQNGSSDTKRRALLRAGQGIRTRVPISKLAGRAKPAIDVLSWTEYDVSQPVESARVMVRHWFTAPQFRAITAAELDAVVWNACVDFKFGGRPALTVRGPVTVRKALQAARDLANTDAETYWREFVPMLSGTDLFMQVEFAG